MASQSGVTYRLLFHALSFPLYTGRNKLDNNFLLVSAVRSLELNMATTTVTITAVSWGSLKWYHKVISSILAVVLLIFSLKLITHYGITAASVSCEQSDENINLTIAVEINVSHEYIFTVMMYVIVNLLRIVEYVLLGK